MLGQSNSGGEAVPLLGLRSDVRDSRLIEEIDGFQSGAKRVVEKEASFESFLHASTNTNSREKNLRDQDL